MKKNKNSRLNSDMKFDVIVIGGGASGMFSAGCAAENGDNVLLIEKKEQLGRKLAITGKGRCNLTNIGEIGDFINNYGSNGRFLYRALTKFFNYDLISFLNSHGVETKIERGGRVFPISDDAGSVLNVLIRYLNKTKVAIKLNSEVEEIVVCDNVVSEEKLRQQKVVGVKIRGSEKIIKADKIIIATGGLSYPLTGSTGDGYKMAKKLGHTIVPLKPALIPLEIKEQFIKKLQGLSLKNVMATVFLDGREIASEFGEMLFAHFGISGPIVLKLSGVIVEHLDKNKKVIVSINFKPALNKEKLDARLVREFRDSKAKSLKNVMYHLLPKKISPVFLELLSISPDKKCSQVSAAEREKILNLLIDFRIEVTKPRPISEAIVTRGGISLKEINPYSMESKKVKGLYFCGEVIDIDGMTGGYNLQAAFSTGYLAALS